MASKFSRRDFVADSAKLALGAMIIPRHVLGATPTRRAPSDTLNFAVVESGVKPGERIVIEGLQKIRPGIKVKAELVPLEEASASPAGPAPSGAASAPVPAASGG